MAEISSLLGLITDEHTREVLIAKMEHMFDAAEDEQKLISDIGSPTKVAVALIRYADNGVVTPEAAAVIDTVTDDDPEQEAEFETLEALDEQPELLIPETEAESDEAAPETEAEPEEEAAPEAEAEPEEEAVAEAEQEAETEPAEEAVPEEKAEPEEELDLLKVLTAKPEEAPAEPEELFSAPETLQAPALEPEPAAEEAPEEEAEEEAAPEESLDEAPEAEIAPVDEDADTEALEEAASPERLEPEASEEDDEEEDEPLTITKVNTFLAILYFIIPGLVIGLPVFLVLLVLNIAFLAVAAVVTTAAVLLVLTGLTPLGLPDMLLCFGAAAAAAAVGLVLLWFTIWFFICVTCGWVRLMTRGGKRISRKEVEIV